MDENKFEIEGEIEENEEYEDFEEEEEEESRRGVGTLVLLIIFIILFLNISGLFVYYQFYLGKGNWDFSFKKRTGSALIVKELEFQRDSLFVLTDSLTNLIGTDFQASSTPTEYEEQPEDEVETPKVSTTKTTKGDAFEVQIGAFRQLNFGRYKSSLRSIDVDVIDGVSKIIMGSFGNFYDACNCRKDLKKVGFNDAFIVKKVNGRRVDFDEYCPGDQ